MIFILLFNNCYRLGIAGVAALGRDWKSMLTWISAVHIITPLLMNFVPESSRWLLASERLERRQEAKATMKDAAIANGIYTQDTDDKIEALVHKNATSTPSKNKAGFLVIFRYMTVVKKYKNRMTNLTKNITLNIQSFHFMIVRGQWLHVL